MQFGRFRFIILIALLASNLLVGVLSLVFLRTMEKRYAALFERSVPVINNLRTLTRELNNVQRLARRVADPKNETAWATLLPQMAEMSDVAKVHALDISVMDSLKNTPHMTVIGNLSREYALKADEFLALARAEKFTEANRFNTESLRPVYDRYMETLDFAANYVETEGNDLRTRYAKDTKLVGGFLLVFAGWPLLVAGILVVIMVLLVIGLFAAVFFPRVFGSKTDGGLTA